MQAAINFMDFDLFVSFLATIIVDHFPLFALMYNYKFNSCSIVIASCQSYNSTEASAPAVLSVLQNSS